MGESLKDGGNERWWNRINLPSSLAPYLAVSSLFHAALFAVLDQDIQVAPVGASHQLSLVGVKSEEAQEYQTALERAVNAALDQEVETVLQEYVTSVESLDGRVEKLPSADVYYRLDSYKEVLGQVEDGTLAEGEDWKLRQSAIHADLQKKHREGLERIFKNHPRETWTGDLEKDLPQLVQAVYLDQNGFFREGNPTVSINLPQLAAEASRPVNEFQNLKTCRSSRYLIPLLKEIYEILGFNTAPLKDLKSILWDGHQAVYLGGVAGGKGRQYHHYGLKEEGTKSSYTHEEGTVMNYGRRLAIWMDEEGLLREEQKVWAQTEARNSFNNDELPDFVVRKEEAETPPTKGDVFAEQLKNLSKPELVSLSDQLKVEQLRLLEVIEGYYGSAIANACAPGEAAFICFPPSFLADAQLATRYSQVLRESKKLYPGDSANGLFREYDFGFSEMVFFWPELAKETVLAMAQKEPPQPTPIPIYDARLQEWLEGVLGPKGYHFIAHPDATRYRKMAADSYQRKEQNFKDFIELNQTHPEQIFEELKNKEKAMGTSFPFREYEYLIKAGRREELKTHLWEKHFKTAAAHIIVSAPIFYEVKELINFPLTRVLANEMNEEYLLKPPTEENQILRLFYGLSVSQAVQDLTPPQYVYGAKPSPEYTLAVRTYYRAETDAAKRQNLLLSLFGILGSSAFEIFPSRNDLDIVDRAWLEEKTGDDFPNWQEAFLRLEFFYTDKPTVGPSLILAEARSNSGLGRELSAHGTPLEEARHLNGKKVKLVDTIDVELNQIEVELATRP